MDRIFYDTPADTPHVLFGVLVVTSFFEVVTIFSKMSPDTHLKSESWRRARSLKILSCTSTRKRVRTCCGLVFGTAGRHPVSRN